MHTSLPFERVASSLADPAILDEWECAYRCAENARFFKRVFDDIVRMLEVPLDTVWLDAGCGTCAHAIRLAQRGYRVHAVDISQHVLDRARAHIVGRGLDAKIHVQRDDLLSLSFADAGFSCILCWGVLMHIADVERAIAELARVLAPGGFLIVSEGNMHSLQSLLRRGLSRLAGDGLLRHTAAGIEYRRMTSSGVLLTREVNVSWLIARFREHGLTLRDHLAGQFTELYTKAPFDLGRWLIHGWNELWFRYVRSPHLAFGNILIFQKTGDVPAPLAAVRKRSVDATRPMSHVPRAVLGIVLSQFPRYDEVFILRELVALAQGDQELIIFSLRPCRDRVIHEQARVLLPRTVYAPFLYSAEVWRSHANFLRHSPRVYLGALAWIFSRHWKYPVILLKTLVLFPKTVHFAKRAQERGVSLLHAGWATYPASSALIMHRLTGIPYSLSGHAHDIYTTNPTLAEKLCGAKFVVTCTEANQRYLLSLVDEHGGGRGQEAVGQGASTKASPLFVNHHGVDLARFTPVSKSTDTICRILTVGSLLPCKGLKTLIDSCVLLRERGLAFHCTIAGGGPLEGRLRKRIARYGLTERLQLTGYVSQEAVVRLYQQAHVVALPLVSTIHWGIPNVLIEALATKTPVICCDLPSMRELVIHGESGWIIPEGDPAALARAIGELWNNPLLREQLAEAGYRRVVESFALEQTGKRLRGLFELNGKGGSLAKSVTSEHEGGHRVVQAAEKRPDEI